MAIRVHFKDGDTFQYVSTKTGYLVTWTRRLNGVWIASDWITRRTASTDAEIFDLMINVPESDYLYTQVTETENG